MLTSITERSRANNHRIGAGTQQAHNHVIMLITTTNIETFTIGMGHSYAIECLNKVAEDIGAICRNGRKDKCPIEVSQAWRKWQRLAFYLLKERLQR